MKNSQIFTTIELFYGLSDIELDHIANICSERILNENDILAGQGEPSSELFIITSGLIEISIHNHQNTTHQIIANLGKGQIVGEIGLVDQGPRSATVRASTQQTTVLVLNNADLIKLCDEQPHIGYTIMRNLAADISFKLRRRNWVPG